VAALTFLAGRLWPTQSTVRATHLRTTGSNGANGNGKRFNS
jgi:hypothetical protein